MLCLFLHWCQSSLNLHISSCLITLPRRRVELGKNGHEWERVGIIEGGWEGDTRELLIDKGWVQGRVNYIKGRQS